MNPLNRMNKERRRQNFSSEFRNAFVVRNKCEQLKLEKQHKSLDRLRAHESLTLTNRKKEILSLQMSILSSKQNENTQDLCIKREVTQLPVADINGTHKMKFRTRTLSVSASTINTFWSGNGKDNRISPSNAERINSLKNMSRSISVSAGQLNYFTRKHFTPQQTDNNNNNEETKTDSSSSEEDETPSGQALWKLLPPIQITPLHKQKSKSLREISSKIEVPARKLSVPQKGISSSWNDLQDCRYLRRRMQQDSCLEF